LKTYEKSGEKVSFQRSAVSGQRSAVSGQRSAKKQNKYVTEQFNYRIPLKYSHLQLTQDSKKKAVR